ncbi:unnamed protein product [Amaranthus hypochondriacus]
MVSFRRIQDAHFVKLGLFYLGFETQQALVILSHGFAPNWSSCNNSRVPTTQDAVIPGVLSNLMARHYVV